MLNAPDAPVLGDFEERDGTSVSESVDSMDDLGECELSEEKSSSPSILRAMTVSFLSIDLISMSVIVVVAGDLVVRSD